MTKMFAECTKKPVSNGKKDIDNPPINLSLCFSFRRGATDVSISLNGQNSFTKEFPSILFHSHASHERMVWLFNSESDRDAEYNRLKVI